MARRGARLILRSVRAHRWPHTVAIVGATGYVAATVGGAWMLGWATDRVIIGAFDDGAEGGPLGLAMAGVIGFSAATGLSVVARRWFLSMAELRTQRDWRRHLLHHYLDVPLSFHRNRPAGELLAHADTDVQTATMVLKPLAFSLSAVLLALVALTVLLFVHPLLALIAAVLFPALAAISRAYIRRVEAPSAVVQRRVGEVSAVAHESFDGAQVVKTLGRERAEVERLRAASELLRDERIRVGRMRGTFEPVIDALPTVGTIALVLIGSWLVDRGSATPGDLVLAAMLFSLLALPLRVVGFFLEEMPRSVVSLERIDRVLAVPAAPAANFRAVGGTGRTLPPGPLAVEIENLVVSHDGHRVLEGVSLTVSPGETVALVGATGAGKSTLFEAIAGLVEVDRGSIRIGGVAHWQIEPGELRRAVALVFQETFLFADSVTDNVALRGPDSSPEPEEVRAALEVAYADGFVDDLTGGVGTIVGERGVTLSGGQRQRIALARALVRTPRLLMLDDATSAIDPRVETEILTNLRAGFGSTLLIVAYRASTIAGADRVAYLDGGRVVATGTHAELLARSDYRALVTAYETEESRL